jgi:hypothetical protein
MCHSLKENLSYVTTSTFDAFGEDHATKYDATEQIDEGLDHKTSLRRTHLFITAIQPLASMPNATSTVKLTATRHGHAAATRQGPDPGGDIGKTHGSGCNTCHTWHAHTAARSRWHRTLCKPGTPPISHNLSNCGVCVSLSMGGRIANESWEKACAQCGGRHARMKELAHQASFLTTTQAWCEV